MERRRPTAMAAELQLPGLRSTYAWLPPHDHSISLPGQIGVEFSRQFDVVRDVDGRGERVDIRPGTVFATGPATVTWADVRRPSEVVEIFPQLHRAPLRTMLGVQDPVVHSVAEALRRAHLGLEPLDSVRASSLAHLLAAQLNHHYTETVPRDETRRWPAAPGALERRQLTRVTAYIDDRLADPILLGDLAAVAGLSPFHFARAFKISTGLTPHAYVSTRRMERARDLVLTSRRTVDEIAHLVGYSNVSHFRQTFRRHIGLGPAELRIHGIG